MINNDTMKLFNNIHDFLMNFNKKFKDDVNVAMLRKKYGNNLEIEQMNEEIIRTLLQESNHTYSHIWADVYGHGNQHLIVVKHNEKVRLIAGNKSKGMLELNAVVEQSITENNKRKKKYETRKL